MDIRISPGPLAGTIAPPPSKSQAHRLLLCAALSEGESLISNVSLSQDIRATLSCMESLGARWEDLGGSIRVHGIPAGPWSAPLPRLDCGESGSTLRFLIPVALAVAGGGVFTGRGRLMERPQQPYFDLFDAKGISHSLENGVLTVRGVLSPGTYALPGNVSSQFFTGLLLALPLLKGDSRIQSTTELESRNYIDMTLLAQESFGVSIRVGDGQWTVAGGQRGRGRGAAVEGDYSQAAFWYAANGLGSRVDIQGLNARSAQGDMRIVPYSMKLRLPGDVTLDVSQCPDLVPPLAACAAVRPGVTSIVGAARLRIKESDRLRTVTQALSALGGCVEERADSLVIHGLESLRGGTVDACNDHRIAMMAAVAATRCRQPVTVLGAECVAKSYPGFWEDYARLGGNAERI